MVKKKGIRVHKRTRDLLEDIDYWGKLSPEERSWLYKFLLEYGQAEGLNDDPLHPKKYHKDLVNNVAVYRRQMHNVSGAKINEVNQAIMGKTKPNVVVKYYTLDDYNMFAKDGYEKVSDVSDSDVKPDQGEILPGAEEPICSDETDEQFS